MSVEFSAMQNERPALPSFRRPPVIEVSLSVQYPPLTELRTPHLGLFWEAIRKKFPTVQEQPPLPPVIEVMGLPPDQEGGMRVELLRVPPVPRCWFMTKDESEVLQVQQDRFISNWRKTLPTVDYPHYEHVRDMFFENFRVYEEFVKREGLGEMVPNQCEVTYVNHIPAGEIWSNPGQLGKVFTVWTPRYSDEFLSDPEDVKFAIRYAITDDARSAVVGRLHISLEAKYSADGTLMFLIILTASGMPSAPNSKGVQEFFDLGRKWIVRGFTSITTQPMHEFWGRNDSR